MRDVFRRTFCISASVATLAAYVRDGRLSVSLSANSGGQARATAAWCGKRSGVIEDPRNQINASIGHHVSAGGGKTDCSGRVRLDISGVKGFSLRNLKPLAGRK